MNRRRYHIQTWGHPVYPDLDYESDFVDRNATRNYPCVDIAVQVVIPASSFQGSPL